MAILCCRLGFAVYDASLFTAYDMSGRIVFAIYCSSPSNLANKLLRLPFLPSGFGTRVTFGSNGVLTESELSNPSFCKIVLMYCLDKIVIESGFAVISTLTIFVGSLMLVTSHSASISAIVLSLNAIVVASMSVKGQGP